MKPLIFVTGYFGAPIREEAERIASCKGWTVLDLDAEIEKKDGRSIARLCMMGGEHAYRNAEYELVEQICEAAQEYSGSALTCESNGADVEKDAAADAGTGAAADAGTGAAADTRTGTGTGTATDAGTGAAADTRTGAAADTGTVAGTDAAVVDVMNTAADAGTDGPDAKTDPAGLVVACGDGILYDDDSRILILDHQLVIAGEGAPLEDLWERARQEEATYHAFMKFGSDDEKRAKFEAHHERQQQLFAQVRENKDNRQ